MIAKFHKWTKLPINKGEPLHYEFSVSGIPIIKRAKKCDDHNCFAAETITLYYVLLQKVNSTLGISLASNFHDDEIYDIKDLLKKYLNIHPEEKYSFSDLDEIAQKNNYYWQFTERFFKTICKMLDKKII